MELLVPVAANTDGADITEVSLAALSLGMVFVGTCNDEVGFDMILSNIGYIRRNKDQGHAYQVDMDVLSI